MNILCLGRNDASVVVTMSVLTCSREHTEFSTMKSIASSASSLCTDSVQSLEHPAKVLRQ